MEITLPHFGKIDLSVIGTSYDASITVNELEVELDITCECGEYSFDEARITSIKEMLANLPALNEKYLSYIKQDFKDGKYDTVRFYIDHFLEAFEREELETLIDLTNTSTPIEVQLLNKLHLIRVGIHVTEEEVGVINDYTIDGELTNYLVVLFTDVKGNLDEMTIES